MFYSYKPYQYLPGYGICTIKNWEWNMHFEIFNAFVFFLIPLLIIIYVYLGITIKLFKTEELLNENVLKNINVSRHHLLKKSIISRHLVKLSVFSTNSSILKKAKSTECVLKKAISTDSSELNKNKKDVDIYMERVDNEIRPVTKNHLLRLTSKRRTNKSNSLIELPCLNELNVKFAHNTPLESTRYKRLASNTSQTSSLSSCASVSAKCIRRKSQMKILKLMIIIVFSFVLTRLPFEIQKLLNLITGFDMKNENSILRVIFKLLNFTSSASNFFIYALFSSQFFKCIRKSFLSCSSFIGKKFKKSRRSFRVQAVQLHPKPHDIATSSQRRISTVF